MGDFWGHIASQRVARAMSLGNDEEAVLDQGKTSSTLYTNFEKEELESHRAVYVGVHVPLGRQSRRRHRHRGHRHHRKRRDRSDREDGRESPTYDTPSQRVQFILGTEDGDEEHIPHDLFTELDELAFRDGDFQEWRETARWLKFEEDVEDGGERWSKPYVATLSLHSLFELRSCILNGTVLLDMRANAIEEIADMVIDSMLASGQLEEGVREKVREAMLRRHHHQNEKKLSNRIPLVRSFADIGKKHSDPHLLDRNVARQPIRNRYFLSRLHGEQQEATEGAVVVAVVPDVSVLPQHHLQPVALLQQQGGAVGRRVAALTGRLLVDDQLDLKVVLVKNGTHGEVGGAVGGETDVVDSTNRDYGLCYLSLRTSIGLWTAFLCLLLVATDASSLVCYITRFTEEAFAALICIIFIYEALEKLVHLGEVYPINMHSQLDNLTFYTCQCSPPANASAEVLQMWSAINGTSENIQWDQLTAKECVDLHGEFVGSACSHDGPYVPDVLFWSVILFFTTFFLSSFLKQFKTKRYFPTKVRSTISDFAIFLTIMIMVLVDYLVGVPSPKLNVPDRFEPTSNTRGWLISPLGPNPWWTLLAAAVPALLCTILIFMDQQITAVIVNRKENKLKKGCGYHLDLLVVAVMLGVCSIMGLPWFVAATVLSISHVNSLKLESECAAPGEQPKFLGIREQRVTGFMIFILMGCSVFMTSALKFIPMPVLYGVFLYMGVSSLRGIQLFDRIKLFGMPAKHQPDLIYLRYVPLWKVHIFTVVQLSCLIVLWTIKASAAAVVFPMMVLALVFIRKLLDFCFTKRELSWLDDLIPESKKKRDDDKKKKEKEEARRMLEEAEDDLPYNGGNVIDFPIKTLKGRVDPSEVNISDEMAKSGIWKSMNSESSKALKRSNSQEKLSSIQINVENEDGRRVVDAETSL
ncbi:sodium bicarbonate cotransporter 3-like [Morone saxatilis]|uniref:sodium bicarbonate cotransporter 3-like n=1 Tax=Morone saxatilis TaxID=34816 RepID=UPI0015E240AC|nr:sodium bicarbonate cotransporter 3-like [Morone saxatilis]